MRDLLLGHEVDVGNVVGGDTGLGKLLGGESGSTIVEEITDCQGADRTTKYARRRLTARSIPGAKQG